MKNLIVSIMCLLLLMVPWGTYQKISDMSTDLYKDVITAQLIPYAESGDWQKAAESFYCIAEDWKQFRSVSVYFIDTVTLNDISATISRLSYYIKTHDVVNTMAEASDLKHAFHCLYENEAPSFGNVF